MLLHVMHLLSKSHSNFVEFVTEWNSVILGAGMISSGAECRYPNILMNTDAACWMLLVGKTFFFFFELLGNPEFYYN
jgi:hypothetical protein